MARELYLGTHLLDRQLLDRDGRRCGKVDDVVLELDEATGHLLVRGLRSGAGALLIRTGHQGLGRWFRRVRRLLDDDEDRGTIPIRSVADIGDHVTLRLDARDLATHDGERWVREHVIGHIPGSGTDARQ